MQSVVRSVFILAVLCVNCTSCSLSFYLNIVSDLIRHLVSLQVEPRVSQYLAST